MKIAIVHNWPGQRNSELELIRRIVNIAGKFGHECSVVDPIGHPLTGDGEHFDTVKFIDGRQYDFCLHLHYVNPNFFDTFSYAVNWNPLNYIVRNPMDGSDLPMNDVAFRTFCLTSHDAILSAGSDEMDDFVKTLNFVWPMQSVNRNLCLHTSAETTIDLDFPDFRQFKVFYIGANWERQQGKQRHDGFIERLDASNWVEFYGVKKQNGIELWAGVKNYRGELPFDGGTSIIEKSNQCGVSLVLHSQAHRDSELVSTRLFQACAAKTLTICDDHSFITKHFGDSVLSFPYSPDPADNARRMMDQVEWIRRHPDAALEKAKRANRIFTEKFSLQKEVADLFEHHQENVNQYLNQFGASDPSVIVDAIYIHRGGDKTHLDAFFTDLAAQTGITVRAVVFSLPRHADEVRRVAAQKGAECDIIQCQQNKKDMLPLDGRLIGNYLETFDCSPFFSFYSKRCRWHRFHLTQLVRALEGKEAIATAGTFVKNDGFNQLFDDYYLTAMESVGTHPKGITEQDLGAFRSGRFTPASFLFFSSDFQSNALFRALRFFDTGWAFFLVLWHYLNTYCLPVFIPKLSVMVQKDGVHWQVDSYGKKNHTEAYEASLAYAFFKNNPKYLSLVESCNY